MSWKLFIVEMTNAIVWPLTISIILLFMKDSLAELVPRILKLRHKDTEIEFSEAMDSLKERAESAIFLEEEMAADLKEEKNRLENLSKIVPRSALLQAWGLIDREVGDYLLESGAKTDERSLKESDVIRRIKDLGLKKSDVENFTELRNIMKSVSGPKNFELDEDEVDSYVELAVDVVRSFRDARSNKQSQATQ